MNSQMVKKYVANRNIKMTRGIKERYKSQSV